MNEVDTGRDRRETERETLRERERERERKREKERERERADLGGLRVLFEHKQTPPPFALNKPSSSSSSPVHKCVNPAQLPLATASHLLLLPSEPCQRAYEQPAIFSLLLCDSEHSKSIF